LEKLILKYLLKKEYNRYKNIKIDSLLNNKKEEWKIFQKNKKKKKKKKKKFLKKKKKKKDKITYNILLVILIKFLDDVQFIKDNGKVEIT